jgi:DNA repair photolyase
MLASVEYGKSSILYPSCDTEVGLDTHRIKEIIDLATTTNAIAVSISTKRKLSTTFMPGLLELNKRLSELDVLLKVSISVSTKYQINDIEKGASSYADRLQMATTLRNHELAASLNLKPVLPFIPTSEYLEIIDDFIHSTPNFMLGGLYLSGDSQFGQSIIRDYPNLISEKTVDWIPGKPIWKICYDKDKIDSIKTHINSHGGCGYLSDKDFILNILDKKSDISNGR